MFNRTTYAAAAAAILAVSTSVALADTDASTLDWPVGNHAWIGLNTGNLDNDIKEQHVLFDDIVAIDNAAWIRLHFGATKLDRDSFIRVTSLRDGEVQELDASTLSLWKSSSAYFNGNAVRVELIAGGLTNNTMSIETATWELMDSDRGDGCGICSADDRTPSSDNRFARLMPVGCSATMYSTDSCFVTAGHCLYSADVLEFNVPDSNSNCSVNHPPVVDQFPVIAQAGNDGGVGSDYGGMKAGTNSSGETPYERYGTMAPIASSIPSSGYLTVNGYGVDSQCVRSQTQQFCDGPMLSLTSDTVIYNLDITYGNSGSSILYNGEIIGVVTHCSYSCENYGTRIDTSGFIAARETTCPGGSDPTGACCVGTSCSVTTEADCGGTYLGDGTNCSGDPCAPDPTGACCYGTSCAVMTPDQCNNTGGTYQGDDTDCNGDPCGIIGGNLSIRWKVIGTDLLSDGSANYTVDVYAETPDQWRIDAVAGNQNQQKTVTSTTSFYQDSYGGPTSQGVNPALYPMVPDLEWDSRVTIGCLDSSGDPFSENALNDIGIDWTNFENGGDLSVGNGTWFIIPTDDQGDSQPFTDSGCTQRNGVLIARLTTMEYSSEILFEALFQGRDDSNVTWQDIASGTITYEGEQDCNGNGNPDACDIANGDSDDANGNGIPDECESDCSGDADGDGDTDVDDILAIINGFGSIYDVDDLLNAIADFGCTG
ncbi:MAG: hypothetical protein QF534_08505 [Phycisphaerales bacterium]|nr:hypothetical protein [Phycisphaerales bacterium]